MIETQIDEIAQGMVKITFIGLTGIAVFLLLASTIARMIG